MSNMKCVFCNDHFNQQEYEEICPKCRSRMAQGNKRTFLEKTDWNKKEVQENWQNKSKQSIESIMQRCNGCNYQS